MDAEADLIPKTADAARVALATYLSLNQPPEGDPRAAVHKAAMVAVDVLGKEVAPHRSTSRRNERATDHNLCNDITQRAVDRRREEQQDREDLEYDEENDPVGATCVGRAICCTRMPVDFKPPGDIVKSTGAQEPKQWLEDFETRIKLLNSTRTTAMQCLCL